MYFGKEIDKVMQFVEDNGLLGTAKKCLIGWLKEIWKENKIQFIDEYYKDLDTVLEKYSFEYHTISLTKNYLLDSPNDVYVSISIRIYDDEGSYVSEYTIFYDTKAEVVDDKMIK